MKKLLNIYETLFNHYGPQNWWPTDSQIEMMIGAILVQNTNWNNVKKSIKNLKPHLTLPKLRNLSLEHLKELIAPSGAQTRKAHSIKDLVAMIHDTDNKPTRKLLLSIHGIGPETADCIMLYAYDQAYFVVDTYLKRLFERAGLPKFQRYEDYQSYMQTHLPNDTLLYKEYHALIVAYGKDKNDPLRSMTFNHTQRELNFLAHQSTNMKELIDMHHPFIRKIDVNPLDTLISTIIGQVINTTLAKQINEEFRKHFPNPVDALNHNLDQFKLSRSKVDTLKRVLKMIREKELQLDKLHEQSDEEIIRILTSIKGIGPWTAKVVLIHGYHREDIAIKEDLVIQKSFEKNFPNQDFNELMNMFSPYRSLATIILWHVYHA